MPHISSGLLPSRAKAAKRVSIISWTAKPRGSRKFQITQSRTITKVHSVWIGSMSAGNRQYAQCIRRAQSTSQFSSKTLPISPDSAIVQFTMSSLSDTPGESAYRPRRAHKKSRGGCSVCKQRRIKVRIEHFQHCSVNILTAPSVMRPDRVARDAKREIFAANIPSEGPAMNHRSRTPNRGAPT